MGCEALASVSIPASVNTIDRYAFRDCNVLENVSNYALIPQTLNSNTFTHYGTLHVVDGYKEVYAAADVWKNFTIIDDLPDANAAYITDGTVYDNEEDSDPSKIVYTRTFSSADKWQALYVPFSIPVDVLTENGLEVVELNNIYMYDTDGDKQFDKTTLEFLYLTDGETEANYPYLIKSANAGEVKLTLKDVELKAAAETQIECASTRKVFKIKGTYTGVSGAEMFNNNYYAVGGGTLVRTASAENALKPQRWYMSIENKDGSPVDYFAPKMRIMVNGMEIDEYEENETGIQEISTQGRPEGTIYTLDGRRLVGTNSLKSGIYVKNHQKMIVR